MRPIPLSGEDDPLFRVRAIHGKGFLDECRLGRAAMYWPLLRHSAAAIETGFGRTKVTAITRGRESTRDELSDLALQPRTLEADP
jgi:hypothetical protein